MLSSGSLSDFLESVSATSLYLTFNTAEYLLVLEDTRNLIFVTKL
jgi:hypothetical protein